VTYDSKTWPRHLRFDVVPYVLDINIGFDQLVAFDDGIRGMLHDGDSTFKALIAACNTVMQARIETKVVGDERILKDMLIDHHQLAAAQRFYILGRVWFNKKDYERYQDYKGDFEDMMEAALAGARYDTGLSGEEPAEIGSRRRPSSTAMPT